MGEWTIGIIGGSGLYAIDALEDAQWVTVGTPWGKPSDELLVGRRFEEVKRLVEFPYLGLEHRGIVDLHQRAAHAFLAVLLVQG